MFLGPTQLPGGRDFLHVCSAHLLRVPGALLRGTSSAQEGCLPTCPWPGVFFGYTRSGCAAQKFGPIPIFLGGSTLALCDWVGRPCTRPCFPWGQSRPTINCRGERPALRAKLQGRGQCFCRGVPGRATTPSPWPEAPGPGPGPRAPGPALGPRRPAPGTLTTGPLMVPPSSF